MKKVFIALFTIAPLFNLQADEVTKTNFRIIEGESVEVVEKECMFALRKTMTEKEAQNKAKYSCYSLRINNAVVETDDGEQMILGVVETRPMVELFNVKASRKCVDSIAESMNKVFKGQALPKGETLELPRFEVTGVSGSMVEVATSENKIFGSRTLGRESINYKNRIKDERCHPHADRPSLNVVESFEEPVVADEDVLGQLGRHAKGFGWNLLRAGEKAVDFTSEKIGITAPK